MRSLGAPGRAFSAHAAVQEDVQMGFAEWLLGGLDEARARFGDACVAGRLGVVQKESCAPRLVGDSTASNANRLCRIAEKTELPRCAWVKLGAGCSKEVRVSKEEAQVADFYHSLVAKNVEVQLVHKTRMSAAADAYVQGQTAGIGGWWMLPSDGICPASILGFPMAIQAAELPDWFVQEHGRSDLQNRTFLR